MNRKKNKIAAIIGTVIFHAILLTCLFLFGLTTPLPLPGEEGVEVNLGYSDQGTGLIQPDESAPALPENPPPQASNEQEENIITQDVEETSAIEKPKEKEDVRKEENITKPVETTKQTDPEPVPEKPQVNPRALYKGKSNNTNQGGQEGETGQPGDQGDPYGSKDVTNHEGMGGDGNGNGISYNLGNRIVLSLPKPEYDSKDQGKVVVTIQVNRQGNVISAVPGAKGTNISDQQLWKVAKQAALRSTFSPDPDAPEIQIGTITYNFIRIN